MLIDLSAKPVIKPLKKQALRECLLLAYTVFVFVWFKVFDFSAKYTGNLLISMRLWSQECNTFCAHFLLIFTPFAPIIHNYFAHEGSSHLHE